MVQTDKKSKIVKKTGNDEAKSKDLKPQGELIFSLDIGTRTVVGVIGEQDEDSFVLTDYVVEPHTKRAMIDGQIEDIKQVAKVVARVKERLEENNGVLLSRVSIAAAGRALHTRRVSMDFDISAHDAVTDDMVRSMELEAVHKAQTELDEAHNALHNLEQDIIKNTVSGNVQSNVQSNAPSTSFYCVGHSVMRYMLDDYSILNLEGHKGQKASVELIATFLPNVVVEGLYSVMDANKLEVDSLTLEPIAAMNVIVPNEIRLINIALVDIGAGTSDIAISRDGTIVAYAMATVAGDEITEEIIRSCFVDFAAAEDMKHASTSGVGEFEYRDIFGITQKIKTADFLKKIDKAINSLVETICENITAVNGGSPAAVFLVGGGALIGGLAGKVAEKLKIDGNRVAIGSNSVLRFVDTGGRQMGAEFITPLGIALTSILNRGYDFSLITLNGEKIRVFDTKALTVFEILTMAGYKTHEIMGRSGRNLTFAVNGKHRTVRGGSMTPSEIYINNKPASINSGVSQGDHITFIPAKCGENARAMLGEALEVPPGGFVSFCGGKREFGAEFFINGERMELTHEIQPLENIEIGGVLTLNDLLQSLDTETEGIRFVINGESEGLNYFLHDGDIISYEQAQANDNSVGKENAGRLKEFISAEDEEKKEPADNEITISFNGENITLPPNKGNSPHLFLELLNHIEIDAEEPNGNYKMLLNGKETAFNTEINDGDTAVLEWE